MAARLLLHVRGREPDGEGGGQPGLQGRSGRPDVVQVPGRRRGEDPGGDLPRPGQRPVSHGTGRVPGPQGEAGDDQRAARDVGGAHQPAGPLVVDPIRRVDRVTERAALEGRLVDADARLLFGARYGHFTSMQVRDRRVRGLDLHVERLEAANAELFGVPLDRAAVLASIRAALGDDVRDATVRVYVVEDGRPRVVAVCVPPCEAPARPQSVKPVAYQRFLPHIKQASGMMQVHVRRQVQREGFDEALLTTGDGLISEGAITNLGGFAGGRLVWPDAPMLHGTTMRLLERMDVPQERRPLRPADLAGFDQVFLCNSWGVWPVGRVGDVALPQDGALMARLIDYYDRIVSDPLD
ncbi:class IV aminotransferase [Nonomuraea phyllanthi]|uniref:Class IV aminotransferase n=1 Tax=Nonomuraea phyllanthi TaxID=2219224 RepID=A0A5C4VQP3_9ACTN|nr:class IV aminotransferase [Nonomuraea phyllanthi]